MFQDSQKQKIIDTLTNLLVPGGKYKFSPYIELAQYKVLFDEVVDSSKRREQLKKIIKKHGSRIESIANKISEFFLKKEFTREKYADPLFLDTYFVHYFPVNVCKMQHMMLELLQQDAIGESLRIVDIGVGTGTTAVAILDFLLATKTVAVMNGAPFDIRDIKIICVDVNENPLSYSKRVLEAYREQLNSSSLDGEIGDYKKILIDCIDSIKYVKHDINSLDLNLMDNNPDLVIASNVLNELTDNGKNNLYMSLNSLHDGALIILAEPGSKTASQNLMYFRKQLSSSGKFSSFSPCVDGVADHSSCSSCWNRRSKGFNQPLLYMETHKLLDEESKKRFTEQDNDLLSWSSAIFRKSSRSVQEPQVENEYRFISSYTLRDYEVLKCCAAGSGHSSLEVHRPYGIEIPPLFYGQKMVITDAKKEVNSGTLVVKLDTNSCVKTKQREKEAFFDSYSLNTEQAIDELAFRLFGFEKMRPFQHKILSRVLTGKSILAIAATGSGKSECYILPSMILGGVTIVVSPLKSLMQDQYEQRLDERYGFGQLAAVINGDVPFSTRQSILKKMELGYYSLVFFTPEQLERSYILESLKRANQKAGIRYIAMDEAHCISQWGHDFRPSYLNIVKRLREYDIDPVKIALTATASPRVREDICNELRISEKEIDSGGDVYIESSNRPEINFIVKVVDSNSTKGDEILSHLTDLDRNEEGSAIVFMPTTGGDPQNWKKTKDDLEVLKAEKNVNAFASFVELSLGKNVSLYHSKMDDDETILSKENGEDPKARKNPGDLSDRKRKQEQTSFINGDTNIMVATKGFGMGIDKSDVRLVIHRTPPANLEAYAQEAGRAGRDGDQAKAILFFSTDSRKNYEECEDFDTQRYFINSNYIREIDVRTMVDFLRAVKRKVGDSLYFTNDEFMEFVDKKAPGYSWPELEKRDPKGKEYANHKEILDRGHLYSEKTKYISRILQNLYKIRPATSTGDEIVFLKNCHDAQNTCKNPELRDWDGIINSNMYFGEILRDSKITKKKFENLLNKELIEMASELNLSLKDLGNMLTDIKYCEGTKIKHWNPRLLNFWYLEAPKYGRAAKYVKDEQWKAYAGAWKRERPTNGGYDWFPPRTLSRRVGWEVELGKVFENEDLLNESIDKFMKIHNERKENDWRSYRRLINDYVGINQNGLAPASERKCLRAVLLGYLQTGEVIMGKSCYSCSSCVPDERFHKYSIEQRKAVVVKIDTWVKDALEKIESRNREVITTIDEERLFGKITQAKRQEKSLDSYIIGWTGRVLDEEPKHLGAIWMRLVSISKGFQELIPADVLNFTQVLLESISIENMKRLKGIIDEIEKLYSESKLTRYSMALIHKGLGEHEQELEILLKLLPKSTKKMGKDTDLVHGAALRVFKLLENTSFSDENKQKALLFAARTSSDFIEARDLYSKIVDNWTFDNVKEEMKLCDKKIDGFSSAALFYAWGEKSEENVCSLIKWVEENSKIVSEWSHEERDLFFDLFSDEAFMSHLILGKLLIETRGFSESNSNLIFHLFANEVSIDTRLLEQSFEDGPNPGQFIADLDEEKRAILFESLASSIEIRSPAAMEKLFAFMPNMNKISVSTIFSLLEKLAQLDFSTSKMPLDEASMISIFRKCLSSERYYNEMAQIVVGWSKKSSFNQHLFRIYLDATKGTERQRELVNQTIKLLIDNGLIDLIPVIDQELDSEIAQGFSKVISSVKALSLKKRNLKNGLDTKKIKSLCNNFNWKEDINEATLLLGILKVLSKYINRSWLFPFSMIIELLILTERGVELAKYIEEFPDVTIGKDKRFIADYARKTKPLSGVVWVNDAWTERIVDTVLSDRSRSST